ncbi:MAG: ABC transporter permease [Thermodesulfobacteriota bacterium]
MTRFFAVVERDLRKFIRNPVVLLMSILMPVLYLVILGNSFLGELKNLPLAVVKHDSGKYGEMILERLYSMEGGPKRVIVYRAVNEGEAMEGLKKGIFAAVLIIPREFSSDILHGKTSEVGLFLDNSEPVASEFLRSQATLALSAMRNDFIKIREEKAPVLREMELYKKIDYDQSLIPGVVIMAIFLGAMTTGVFNVVMDRFMGIEESYFLTPLTKMNIVTGLIVSGLFITTVLALVVLAISSLIAGLYFWTTITFGAFIALLLVIALSTLSLQGLMFVILGRVDHPRIVGVLGGFLNVILFFPSGAMYPVESFPAWLKAFSRINPETYSVHAMRAILFKGADVFTVKEDLLLLSVTAVVLISLATVVFKREL